MSPTRAPTGPGPWTPRLRRLACAPPSGVRMNETTLWRASSILIPVGLTLSSLATAATFDTVISNGHIVDGTGSPWYSGDVGIREGRIAAIGTLATASRDRTIDAHCQVVAPGFIDMLGQSELTILVDPRLPSKIYQGITTEITGEGGSAAPVNDALIKAFADSFAHLKLECDWRTFA